MKKATVTVAIILSGSVALAARVWSRTERAQLSASRATAFNNALTGQLPTCTNWQEGTFVKECANGAAFVRVAQNGTCPGGFSLVTTLYPKCRYTAAVLADVPDDVHLETE